MVEINRWGRGGVQKTTSALDGEMEIVQTPFGAYFYELNPLRLIWFAENSLGSVLSPDNRKVALNFHDGEVRVYDLKTGEEIYLFKHDATIPKYPSPWFSLDDFLSVRSMLFSSMGNLLAVGYGDNQIEVWNIERGKSSALLANEIAPSPMNLVFSSDGTLLASSDGENIVVWSLGDQKPVIRIPKVGSITQGAFSPDRSLLVSSKDLSILVWGLPNGNLVYNYGVGNYVGSVRFSDDGRQLEVWAVGGGQVRDLLTGHLVAGATPPQPEPVAIASAEELSAAGHWSDIKELVIPSEHYILASGVNDSLLYFLSLPDGSLRYLAQQGPSDSKLVVSPDGKLFAYCFGGQLWSGEVDSLEPKVISTCRSGQLAISNQWIARGENTWLQILDPSDGTVQSSFQGHAHHITMLEFSTDGSFLASGSRNTDFWLWSLDPPQGVMKILDVPNGVVSAAVSPDASLVAFSYGSEEGIPIRVLDVSSARTLALITDGENGKLAAESLAFSPDSRILAASDGNSIYLFSRDTWKVVAVLSGHLYGVKRLVFSQDGENLISSSFDGTIRVWGIPGP